MRKTHIILLTLLAGMGMLASPLAQSKVAWDYDPATHFKVCIDSQPCTPNIAANIKEWAIGSISDGQHSVVVQSCNQHGCNSADAVTINCANNVCSSSTTPELPAPPRPVTNVRVLNPAPPMANSAFEFNGSNAQVSYSHVTQFDGISKLTISLWVYPIDAGFYGAFAAQTDGNNGFEIMNESGTEQNLFLSFRNGSNVPQRVKNSVLTASAWNHIWIVYDGGAPRTWVNGVEITTWNIDTGSWPATLGSNSSPLTLGAENSAFFNNCRIKDPGFLIGRAVTDSTTIAGASSNMSVGNYLEAGDLWADTRNNPPSMTGYTATVTNATHIDDGPALTYPSGGGGGAIAALASMAYRQHRR